MAHILVVDDRPANLELIETVLGYGGHTVQRAADGVDALALMARRRPDLVITDLLMPNMDGEEMCLRMRADPALRDLRVIIHTASYRSREARRVAERLNVRWILTKPSGPAEIIALVNEALGPDALRHSAALDAQPGPPAAADGGTAESGRQRNLRLARLLEHALELGPAQAQAGRDASVRDSASLGNRLDGLVRLSVRMSAETDPQALVDLFCAASQELLGARYAGVAMLSQQGDVRAFASRGLDALLHAAVAADIGRCPAVQHLIGEPGRSRMLVAAKEDDFTGLPPAHPPVRGLLACPVSAREQASGWMYVADALGNAGFAADDERLLVALGALLGTFWSSLMAVDELDRRVAQRTRELEAANAELEAFSMLVSHDLRAPLGSIDGFSKALSHQFGASLPPQAQRYLEKIGNGVAVMSTLIDDLLHFAKMSRQPIAARSVALESLVRDCLAHYRDEIEGRGIVVEVGPLPTCRADPSLLAQVLSNLVGNAVKYTRKAPQARIEVGSRRVADEHLVFVRDNGAGFDAVQ
ncbi:MAG TPA: response regulator, partial [Ramlibacter sp.]|nr:response regulator [Ramlibacter sp.]